MSDQYPPRGNGPQEPDDGYFASSSPPPPPEPAASPPPPPAGSGPPTAPAAPGHAGPDRLALRPRRLGELLDAAFTLYRAHWKILLGVAAVAVIPLELLFSLLALTENVLFVSLAGVLSVIVVTPLVTAALVKAGADVYLGRTPTIGETYSYAFSRFVPLLGAILLVGLGVILGFILLIIPGIILIVRWYFASAAVVLEDAGATDAMRRSWRLTSGHFWKVLGTLVVAGIIAGVAALIISLPFAFGPAASRTVGDILASVIVQPFSSLVALLLYFDLRIRDEGFDLEVMARELRAT